MTKGEIWLTQFPQTDTHEQSGTRPVIVIADLDPNTTIVIPFTSNLQALRYFNTIEIPISIQNGLIETSIALIFQIRAIDRKRLIKNIGTLENSFLIQIDKILKNIFQI